MTAIDASQWPERGSNPQGGNAHGILSPGETSKNPGLEANSDIIAALGAVVSAEVDLENPDLNAVIDAWPDLSENANLAILEFVNTGCEVAGNGS